MRKVYKGLFANSNIKMKPLLTSKLRIKNKIFTLEKEGLRENFPEYLILHSTYKPKFDDVLGYHRYKNFAGVGYHLFVSDSSKIYQSRPFNLEGAHALGFNTNSIGLCFYTENGDISEKIKNSVKKMIRNVKSRHPEIRTISHTQAQLMYLNRLLKQEKINKQFPTDENITNKESFQKIKVESDLFFNYLESSESSDIKYQIKRLKNCPGEAFKYFI